jgi:hypothetical protein
MRTLLIGASTILLLLAAASCGKSSPPAETSSTTVAAAPGSAASATVPELADYPGATRVSFERKSDLDDGWSAVTKAEFTSSASFSDVVAHYEAVIAEGGWTVNEVKTRADKAEWKLAKKDSVAEIDLEAERGIVEIKLERKDR